MIVCFWILKIQFQNTVTYCTELREWKSEKPRKNVKCVRIIKCVKVRNNYGLMNSDNSILLSLLANRYTGIALSVVGSIFYIHLKK